MPDQKPLVGRAAIVTGSGRRIGREIAEALARAGAAVVVNARANAAEAGAVVATIEKAGGRAVACLADVSKREDAERLVATAVETFGRLDILVNNAAVRARREIADITDEEWRRVVGVVLDGSFFLSRAAIPHLAKGGKGRIINIGGATAFTGADAHAHVVAAKAGLSGLTRALATELGRQGITVNMVSPGLVEAPGDDPRRSAERRHHYNMDKIALGRPASPDDIAGAVVAIAGDSLAYLTGQTVHMNGGFYMT
jgi:3-oxoacyl-[acyl-carrier protein] reductase